MQGISSPQIYCQLHQLEPIKEICINPICSNRTICAQCRIEHEKSHLAGFIPIKEFFSSDYAIKIEKLNEMAYQNDKIYQDKLILIDAIVTELRARFEYSLLEFKNNLLRQLSLYDSKVNCDWDLLRAKFSQISSIIEEKFEFCDSSVHKRQNEYIDLCLDIDKKISKLKIERGVIQNFISYSDKNMERFTNQTQRMMDEFAYLSNMSKYEDSEESKSSEKCGSPQKVYYEDNSGRMADLFGYRGDQQNESSSPFTFLRGLFT
jgi:hypothetical protein